LGIFLKIFENFASKKTYLISEGLMCPAVPKMPPITDTVSLVKAHSSQGSRRATHVYSRAKAHYADAKASDERATHAYTHANAAYGDAKNSDGGEIDAYNRTNSDDGRASHVYSDANAAHGDAKTASSRAIADFFNSITLRELQNLFSLGLSPMPDRRRQLHLPLKPKPTKTPT
jgi:hypothetical protein